MSNAADRLRDGARQSTDPTPGSEAAADLIDALVADLRMIQSHAKQAQLQPQYARDHAWEIERLAAAAIAKAAA